MQKKSKKNQITSAPILYESKDLKIYSDIHTASVVEILYSAIQEPLDRIRETVQLILRIYPLAENKTGNDKIYIDKS